MCLQSADWKIITIISSKCVFFLTRKVLKLEPNLPSASSKKNVSTREHILIPRYLHKSKHVTTNKEFYGVTKLREWIQPNLCLQLLTPKLLPLILKMSINEFHRH